MSTLNPSFDGELAATPRHGEDETSETSSHVGHSGTPRLVRAPRIRRVGRWQLLFGMIVGAAAAVVWADAGRASPSAVVGKAPAAKVSSATPEVSVHPCDDYPLRVSRGRSTRVVPREDGVAFYGLRPGHPLWCVGLLNGDVVRAVDGRPVRGAHDDPPLAEGRRVTVLRNGVEHSFVLAELPH